MSAFRSPLHLPNIREKMFHFSRKMGSLYYRNTVSFYDPTLCSSVWLREADINIFVDACYIFNWNADNWHTCILFLLLNISLRTVNSMAFWKSGKFLSEYEDVQCFKSFFVRLYIFCWSFVFRPYEELSCLIDCMLPVGCFSFLEGFHVLLLPPCRLNLTILLSISHFLSP